MALIFPSCPSCTSTTMPVRGGTSDFHIPWRENGYCCPSTISRPGPASALRKTLPRFCMFFLKMAHGKQLYECKSECYDFSALGNAGRLFPPSPGRLRTAHSLRIAQRTLKNRHGDAKFTT